MYKIQITAEEGILYVVKLDYEKKKEQRSNVGRSCVRVSLKH